MSVSRFDNIRVVLAEPEAKSRKDIQFELKKCGFNNVLATGNLSDVVGAVKRGEVDLLIGDTKLPEGDLTDLIFEMRHGVLGGNPFVVTLTMISNPTQERVRQVINSGTDDILVRPFATRQLIDHIQALTYARKKFVVTSDYIGPDRRKTHREGSMKIAQIDVPNPLRNRITGQVSEAMLRKSIETTFASINEQKVERHAFQIGYLMERLIPAFENARHDTPETAPLLDRLCDVAGDLSQRICKTRYAHIAEMCMTLDKMTASIREKGLEDADIVLIGKLTKVIGNAFDPDRNKDVVLRKSVSEVPRGDKEENENGSTDASVASPGSQTKKATAQPRRAAMAAVPAPA
ncbi:response regulator [Varunaivibrio sulfuroxidans]|uniref:Response regulator receiver domain-containing protein n=1 Tax=Varunaivibrio sulfuroxidans TaxID=1773489 RepID=A0A4R3JBT6_9PROT|nr:response regulator [Varunaivibrio sulfuroxidans]TCS63499.1 response regulator receiver domain-containing protein [Varunaivibrio sulfuroxidans]WES30356.1 response regulator [Varunaivibrio sulfuroxidans]